MADPSGAPPRLLHIHGSFTLGGKEARAVRLMNLWGGRAHHSIVSADPDAMDARAAIDPAIHVDFPPSPPLKGRPNPARFRAIGRLLSNFDLVLTYNWGAMDAVMSHRLCAPFMRLPPLIHHEDGFNADETAGLKARRTLYRRLALGGSFAVVVPSIRLEHITRHVWRQPHCRIHLIQNGIDVARYVATPAPDAIPGLVRSPGKLLVGTLAGLRPVKNIPRLIRAIAPHRDRLQLVVVGEGPERQAILAEAERHGIDDLHMAGFLPDPWRYVGLLDIFALSSDSEQFPISLVEAMAAGLPVASMDVGDVAQMVAPENRAYVVADEQGLSQALETLSGSAELRARLGAANRARACRDFDEATMVEAYAALYGEALSSPHILR
ncbi:glycosyltransferase [Sphingobium vermicomposti]|uniref:Glycosyltransferase involved in cell wall biosynthesis n=1 Tax=Sphingobium vermicomposti TaxID=529005 RepID=A0A846M574_9SPHN|nr:glycosyltransferase [Sphingobium vermicomposti]NIJ16673.1 glycosyltransferase involved in cell wall biosynthesis [Sphingobium vermicomposti]